MIFQGSTKDTATLNGQSYKAWLSSRGLTPNSKPTEALGPALSGQAAKKKDFLFVVPGLATISAEQKTLLTNLIKATGLSPSIYEIVPSLTGVNFKKNCFVLSNSQGPAQQDKVVYLDSLQALLQNPEAKAPVWKRLQQTLGI